MSTTRISNVRLTELRHVSRSIASINQRSDQSLTTRSRSTQERTSDTSSNGKSGLTGLSSLNPITLHSGSLSESRRVLQAVRKQVAAIRATAVSASRFGASPSVQSAAQTSIDKALATIDALTSQPSPLGGSAATTGSGSLLDGEVLSTATAAALTYVGDSNARVRSTASFNLQGPLGSARIHIKQGERLSAVRDRINQLSETLGVAATLDGNRLLLGSLEVGSAATVSVELLDVEPDIDVTGINTAQVADLQIDSFEPDVTHTLNGTLAAATPAELIYEGANGARVVDTATFTVTGANGSAQINVTGGESLADAAARINAVQAQTGVTASVSGKNLVFQTDDIGSAASLVIDLNYNELNVSNVNPTQVAQVDVLQIDPGAIETVSGTVTSAAERAQLDYQGGPGGVVSDSATFTLTGDTGSSTISIERGESLADVATRINAVTGTTGVTAAVSGETLQLTSTQIGGSANLSIAVEELMKVDGANPAQITNLTVDSFQTNAAQTLAGTVVNAAERGELAYTGVLGQVTADATITIEGNLGSTEISVVALESLSDVAGRINAETVNTGVVAEVQGDTLMLRSAAYGSDQSVFVETTAGLFVVTGGTSHNGGQIDYGRHVEAQIGGNSVTGTGNTLTYAEGPGAYTIEFATGFSGEFDPINVISIADGQNLTDGSGVGITGVNSNHLNSVTVNTSAPNSVQSLSGVGITAAAQADLQYTGDPGGLVSADATLTLSGNTGSTSISLTQGEALSDVAARINAKTVDTGVTAAVLGDQLLLDSEAFGSGAEVFVRVDSGTFAVQGGNSHNGGTIAYGVDVVADINGTQHTGTGNQLTFSEGAANYTLDFTDGFSGTFDTVTVRSIDNAFQLSGGNGDGTDSGQDAQATINGQSLTGNGNQFDLTDGSLQVSLEFVEGFSGTFDPISINNSNGDFTISGGNGDSTANGTDASAVVNGQNFTGTDNQVTFSDNFGEYTLEVADGFTGAFDSITVESVAGVFSIEGGNGAGFAQGTDLQALVNGVQVEGVGNQLTISDESGTYTLQIDPDFTGPLSQLTSHRSQAPPLTFSLTTNPRRAVTLPSMRAADLGGRSGRLDQLASGGKFQVSAGNADRAIRIADEALEDLAHFEALLNTLESTATRSPHYASSIVDSVAATQAVGTPAKLSSAGQPPDSILRLLSLARQ